MEKKRTRAQDAAKGLMIIAVVFFHCYLLVAPNPTAAVMNFNILAAFFPFLLSTFFFDNIIECNVLVFLKNKYFSLLFSDIS